MCLEVPRGDGSEMTGLYSTKGIIYYLDRNDRRGDRIPRSHHKSLTEALSWAGFTAVFMIIYSTVLSQTSLIAPRSASS